MLAALHCGVVTCSSCTAWVPVQEQCVWTVSNKHRARHFGRQYMCHIHHCREVELCLRRCIYSCYLHVIFVCVCVRAGKEGFTAGW